MRGSRLLSITALVVAACVPTGFAAAHDALPPRSEGSPPEITQEGWEQLGRLTAAAKRASSAHEKDLEAPAAEAKAAGTADDFTDLTSAEARDLLKGHGSKVTTPAGWPQPELADGQRLEPLSPFRAAIVGGDEPGAMVASTAPMAFEDSRGQLKPIDLGLSRTSTGLEPKDSALPLLLPDHVDEPIVIGDGADALRITPGAAPEAPVMKTDTGAFYANIATDTDFFVKPIVGGAETYHVLRSANSPEVLTFHIDLPDGASLRDTDGKGYAILEGEHLLGSISRVVAEDDAGRPVPVETTVNADGLVIRVAHRAGTYNYPIVVDPAYDYIGECWSWVSAATAACQFDDWEQAGSTDYGNSTANWAFTDNDTDGMHRYGDHFAGAAYLGTGLYLKNWNYNYFRSAPGDRGGQWWFTAPAGVRIFRAAFANLSTDNLDSNPTCAYIGLWESTGRWFPYSPHNVGNCAKQTINETFWACDINCRSSAGTYGNSVVFGVIGLDRWGNYYMHHMGTAVLYMTDDGLPAIRAADAPAPGDPVEPSRSVSITYGDYGVGVKRVTYTLDGQPWSAPTVNGGTGNYYCANGSGGVTSFTCAHNEWISLKVGDLSPGTHHIHADIVDVVGHQGAPMNFDVTVGSWPTSIEYGGSNRAVDTADELSRMLRVLESEVLSDTAVNDLWAGLTPSDRTRVSGFAASHDDPFLGSLTDSADQILGGDDDAVIASVPPEPSYENAKDLGSCGALGHQENFYSFAKPSTPFDGIPSSHLFWRVGTERYEDPSGRAYRKILVELRITAAFRALMPTSQNVWLTAKTVRTVTGEGPKIDGNAQSREASRSTRLYNYFHGTVAVYEGQNLYLRGRFRLGAPVPGEDAIGKFVYKGSHYPKEAAGYRWLSCSCEACRHS